MAIRKSKVCNLAKSGAKLELSLRLLVLLTCVLNRLRIIIDCVLISAEAGISKAFIVADTVTKDAWLAMERGVTLSSNIVVSQRFLILA